MSLKVSIGQGTRGVIVEKDRKKERKVKASTPPSTIFYFRLPIFMKKNNCSRENIIVEVQGPVL